MKTCLFFLSFFLPAACLSQTNTGITKDSIYKKGSWRMNGQKLKPKQFEAEIYKVPEAVVFYKKSNQNFWATLGTATLMSTLALLMPEYRKDTYPPKTNYGRYIVLGIGSGLCIHFSSKSNQNLRKAVKIHNEKIALLY